MARSLRAHLLRMLLPPLAARNECLVERHLRDGRDRDRQDRADDAEERGADHEGDDHGQW